MKIIQFMFCSQKSQNYKNYKQVECMNYLEYLCNKKSLISEYECKETIKLIYSVYNINIIKKIPLLIKNISQFVINKLNGLSFIDLDAFPQILYKDNLYDDIALFIRKYLTQDLKLDYFYLFCNNTSCIYNNVVVKEIKQYIIKDIYEQSNKLINYLNSINYYDCRSRRSQLIHIEPLYKLIKQIGSSKISYNTLQLFMPLPKKFIYKSIKCIGSDRN